MSSIALDMARNDGILYGVYFTVVYLIAGGIIAAARWHIWQRPGDTVWKVIIAPVAQCGGDVPLIKTRDSYLIATACIWPATFAWNLVTLFILLIWGAIYGIGGAIATAWHPIKSAARAGYHFLRASPAKRAQRKILRLERRRKRLRDESSRRQYLLRGEIARDRIRLTALDRKINDLSDQLPAATGEPYRAARLRAVS